MGHFIDQILRAIIKEVQVGCRVHVSSSQVSSGV